MDTLVMVFGTFDGLHEGHLDLFRQAKSLGNHLIVVVSRDRTTLHIKGRLPRRNQEERLRAVQQCRLVDRAVLGNTDDKHAVIVQHKPAIIALGYDQHSFESGLEDTLARHGLTHTRIVRLQPYKPEIYKSSHMKSSREQLKTNLRRIWIMAIQGFKRHTLMTIAATTVMAVTLFSVFGILLLRTLTATALDEINRRIDLVADVNDSASIVQVVSLIKALRQLPHVVAVTYLSKDEALNRVVGDSGEQELKNFLEKYNIENPLSAKIHIVTEDPSQHDEIRTFLKAPSHRELVSVRRAEEDPEYQSRIQRLKDITVGARQAGIGILLLFSVVAFLIILNTIRITIHNRMQEIEIMQLVGAPTFFIHGPFIIESSLYGIGGLVISILLFGILVSAYGSKLIHYFGANTLSTIPFISYFAIALLFAIVLAVLSTIFAVRRYIRPHITL